MSVEQKTPLDILEQKDSAEFYLQILTEKEQGIIMAWCSGDSYVKIGEKLGLTGGRVGQITKGLIRKLRQFAGVKSHIPETLKLLGFDRDKRNLASSASAVMEEGVRVKAFTPKSPKAERPTYTPTYKSTKRPWVPHVWRNIPTEDKNGNVVMSRPWNDKYINSHVGLEEA